MISLRARDSVVRFVANQYPKTRTSDGVTTQRAEQAIAKYLTLVEKVLVEAIVFGNKAPAMGWYTVLLGYLAKKSPRITEKKLYVHSLLSKERLQPLLVENKGSNLTGRPSMVYLNHEHYEVGLTLSRSVLDSEDIIKTIWEIEGLNLLSRYPDIRDIDREVQVAPEGFQLTPINMDSLEDYLRGLFALYDEDANIDRGNLRGLISACMVAIIAYQFHGRLVNRIEEKPYGRVYQLGIGVQNLPKTLRPVILNPAYEYDIGSSVFSWRLSMAIKLGLVENNPSSIKARFPATYEYTTKTSQVRRRVVKEIHQSPNVIDPISKIAVWVKKAITALSNGAKMRQSCYFDPHGVFRVPAIPGILQRDEVLISAFENNETISSITNESAEIAKSINKFWRDGEKDKWPSHPDGLYYKNGAIAMPRLLTFLYQHFETDLMDRFCVLLGQESNNQVIARIHDAVVVREKISAATLAKIIRQLKEDFSLPVLRLDGKKL